MTNAVVIITSSNLDTLISAAAGLGGALIGAGAAVWLDRRSQRSRRAAFRQIIRLDIMRTGEIYRHAADSWRRTAPPNSGLPWKDALAEAGLHFPPRLFVQLANLYRERDQAESAYETATVKGIRVGASDLDSIWVAYTVRFAMHRWFCLARVFIEDWQALNATSNWRRRIFGKTRPVSYEDEQEWLDDMHARAAEALRSEFGYEVDSNGNLLRTEAQVEKGREVFDKRIRRGDAPVVDQTPQASLH